MEFLLLSGSHRDQENHEHFDDVHLLSFAWYESFLCCQFHQKNCVEYCCRNSVWTTGGFYCALVVGFSIEAVGTCSDCTERPDAVLIRLTSLLSMFLHGSPFSCGMGRHCALTFPWYVRTYVRTYFITTALTEASKRYGTVARASRNRVAYSYSKLVVWYKPEPCTVQIIKQANFLWIHLCRKWGRNAWNKGQLRRFSAS